MSVKESTITKSLLKYLNTIHKCRAVKQHTGMYGRRGTPDILCVLDGQTIFIEVKKPGKRATVIQNVELNLWAGVGAICFVCDNLDYLKTVISEIMEP